MLLYSHCFSTGLTLYSVTTMIQINKENKQICSLQLVLVIVVTCYVFLKYIHTENQADFPTMTLHKEKQNVCVFVLGKHLSQHK